MRRLLVALLSAGIIVGSASVAGADSSKDDHRGSKVVILACNFAQFPPTVFVVDCDKSSNVVSNCPDTTQRPSCAETKSHFEMFDNLRQISSHVAGLQGPAPFIIYTLGDGE